MFQHVFDMRNDEKSVVEILRLKSSQQNISVNNHEIVEKNRKDNKQELRM